MAKTFQQLQEDMRASYEWFTFEVDEYSVHILFSPVEGGVLEEARHRGVPLGGQYSGQLHRAHSKPGMEHIHVYDKSNQLFAMNVDGTAHDKSHGTRIPNKVATAIRKQFPQFVLPPGNVIESAQDELVQLFRKQLLLE